MLPKNELKEQIIFHLKNFSKESAPLNARYFYCHLVEEIDFSTSQQREKLKGFQRTLADIISQIQVDQMAYEQFAVLSCDAGYYIPQTEAGFIKGMNYWRSKIDEVQQKIRWADKMRLKTVYKKGLADIDVFS